MMKKEKRLVKLRKSIYQNKSDEQKQRENKRAIQTLKNYYANITDEEYQSIQDKKKETHKNLSKEEKDRRSQMFSKLNKDWWNSLSDEEKILIGEHRSKGVQEDWDNKTQEEFEEWSINVLDGIKKSYEESKLIKNKLEREFKELLDGLKINNDHLYRNKIKHPEFNKLFPINPVTGGRVSPYHNWDFIIFDKNGNKLIDIDGSIHNIVKQNKIVKRPKGKRTYLKGDYVAFNDSQRPYQTDGLDAYIIIAYKDRLNNDIDVLRFNKDKNEFVFYKRYKDFINELLTLSIVEDCNLMK